MNKKTECKTDDEEECLPEFCFNGKKLILTDKEWKQRLTPEQYNVLREGGTEAPFENEYAESTADGIYVCAGCSLPLYRSSTKYHSGSGWPSFWEPINLENISYREDDDLSMTRIEVLCSRCGGHLGHVFDDGPPPTGKRYCMNSAALKFVPKIT